MCETCGCNGPDHAHQPHEHPHHPAPVRQQIPIGRPVMARNDRYAQSNRNRFAELGLFVVNLISSPGSGKTALLEALARRFGRRMAVIEGDVKTSRDADRVTAAGSPAFQIETEGACHLDAHSVGHALEHLDLTGVRLLVIENVGNLVCPSTYDLGEHEKMAILSLPEGDDKVLKYPALFHRVKTVLINKIDLQPYLTFDIEKAVAECRSLNAGVQVLQVSATRGDGMDALFGYLEERLSHA
jgi:hydrogenase nickel incorporation protein HypB